MVTAVIVLIVALASFFGGMQYQKTRTFTNFGDRQFPSRGNFQAQNMPNGQAGRMPGGRVIGEIISIENNTLTVKTQDGGSKIVLLSENTTYSRTSESTKADLKTGEPVGVFGLNNADGSVTASEIQLNPVLRPASGAATQN